MNDVIDHARQTCPTWCASDHPAQSDLDGFHHDSQPQTVELGNGPGREAGHVRVLLSKFEPPVDDEAQYTAHVELRGGLNGGSVDVTLLSPVEARALALRLLDAADACERPS